MSLTPASPCSPPPCRLLQPALELQQERLELDSGKNRSGRDQPVRAEEAAADFVQDSSPLLQKRPPPPPSHGRARAGAGGRGLPVPDAGPRRTDSPPGSLVGPGKAVPRLRCFRFGLPGMNHPPFPPPGLFSSLLRPRPPWAASGPEQHRPGVGAERWSRSRRPCAVVRAPGGRGQWGPGVRSRPPGSRSEAAAAPVRGLARSDPRPRPCRLGPDPCTSTAPRAGCRKGAG